MLASFLSFLADIEPRIVTLVYEDVERMADTLKQLPGIPTYTTHHVDFPNPIEEKDEVEYVFFMQLLLSRLARYNGMNARTLFKYMLNPSVPVPSINPENNGVFIHVDVFGTPDLTTGVNFLLFMPRSFFTGEHFPPSIERCLDHARKCELRTPEQLAHAHRSGAWLGKCVGGGFGNGVPRTELRRSIMRDMPHKNRVIRNLFADNVVLNAYVNARNEAGKDYRAGITAVEDVSMMMTQQQQQQLPTSPRLARMHSSSSTIASASGAQQQQQKMQQDPMLPNDSPFLCDVNVWGGYDDDGKPISVNIKTVRLQSLPQLVSDS